jgi:hypothetical protein
VIEAINPHGELHRPKRERQRGICYACGGDVVAMRVPSSKCYAWWHKKTQACLGPDDGWRERIREGVAKHGFAHGEAGDYLLGPGGAVAFADGPQPVLSAMLDAFEFDMKAEHGWLTWVVDGRYASLASDLNYPGHDSPRWLAGTEWSPFVQTWLSGRQGVTVAIELGYCLPKHEAPLFFVVRKPWTIVIKRTGGDLAGLPITGAHGYLVTFSQLVQHAKAGRGPHTIDTHSLDRYRFGSQSVQRVYR